MRGNIGDIGCVAVRCLGVCSVDPSRIAFPFDWQRAGPDRSISLPANQPFRFSGVSV